MTDLEITRLCAAAMGYEDKSVGESIGGIMVKGGGHHFIYDPLHDDAQAMALGKKFPEEFKAAINEWAWKLSKGEDFNLNYHLCGRIAERQNELKTR